MVRPIRMPRFLSRRGRVKDPLRARRRCDMAMMMVVSDGEWLGVDELLDSFDTYLDGDYGVVVIDDVTTDGTYERLVDRGLWVARNPEKRGFAKLDVTMRQGFLLAWRMFDAPLYVKIDPDALIINPGLRACLLEAFAGSPEAGIAGTLKIDWDGHRRDLGYWRKRMERVRRSLGRPLKMAVENGYEIGDGVQGGCYAISGSCLSRMVELGFLDKWRHPNDVLSTRIAEDSIMTMLAYAAGFSGVEVGGPGQSFGLWHQGLPMSPEELVAQNRGVTHQMKYEDEESLAARAFFKEKRRRDRAASR